MDDFASPTPAATSTSGRLIELRTFELLRKFGKGGHKPGSGSAAALQGILSAHLLRTVISLTSDPKRGKQYSHNLPTLLKTDSDIELRLLPTLEKLFQEDSDQFDVVFQLRQERDKVKDNPAIYKQAVIAARTALMPATEMPIQIAQCCVELAAYGLTVFDRGFKAARGDSGVAINSALGAVAGCLSIVELNLLSFTHSEWADRIRRQRNEIREKLNGLNIESQRRLTLQVEASETNAWYLDEVQNIARVAKAKDALSNREIELFARRLQKAIWKNRAVLWKSDITQDPYVALDPKMALESLGFYVARPPTIGRSPDGNFEVAGTIDQQSKDVSISNQFPRDTQNFTAAHELGHSILHTQAFLHRDRPLDGTDIDEPDAIEEIQANKFAVYFLMPRNLVGDSFLNIFSEAPFRISEATAFAIMTGPAGRRTPQALRRQCRNTRGLARLLAATTFYNGNTFKSLSELFTVSTEAMAIRLEELKLVEF